MYKAASKFLFALSAVGFISAIAWSAATSGDAIGLNSFIGPLSSGWKGYVGEDTGYSMLASLSLVSLSLAGFLAALREGDAEAGAQSLDLETVPEVLPASHSYWPVVGAFSLAAVGVGLAVGPELFVIGCIGLVVTTVEWAAAAWADRASADEQSNRELRNSFMYPVEIPGLAVLAIGGTVLAVSRILLALPKVGSIILFGAVPVLVMTLGALFILKPKISQSAIAAIVLVGAFALLTGGVVAAIHGEREHGGSEHNESGEEHETGLGPVSQVSTAGGN